MVTELHVNSKLFSEVHILTKPGGFVNNESVIDNDYQNRIQAGIRGRLFLLAALTLSGAAFAAKPKEGPWEARVPLMQSKLKEAVQHYGLKDEKAAKRACDDAYFALFEQVDANMEVALRTSVSAQLSAELETGFGDIRKQIVAKKDIKEVEASVGQLVEGLRAAARRLDKEKVKVQ